MKIIYVSSLCTVDKFESLFNNSSNKPGQQIQKYHRMMVEGFTSNGVEVTALSALPVTRGNCKDLIVPTSNEQEGNVKYKYLPIINIPGVKHILTFTSSFISTIVLCLKNRETVVICDVLNISISYGALAAAKILKRKSLAIVTDMPKHLAKKKRSGKVFINQLLLNAFDIYLLLTKQMADLIKCGENEYIVIEGLVDSKMKNYNNLLDDKHEKKVCIYAGGLNKAYGIEYLVDSFVNIDDNTIQFHVYGDGDFRADLEKIAEENEIIKYFGVVPNQLIVDEEIKATLLINPRPSNEEFTHYSFPSKNMEYMVSGTPVLTTKLAGMPNEYNEYVYLIEEENSYGLRKQLINILNCERSELHEKGLRAKKYVLENKNNIVQTKKILDFLNGEWKISGETNSL